PSFNAVTGQFPYNPILGPNPLVMLDEYEAPEDVTRFVGGFEAQYRPMPNLSIRYLAGVDDYRREVRFLQPPRTNSATFTGSVQNPVQFSRQFNNDLLASYDWTLSESIGMATGAGLRFTSDDREVLRAAATGLAPEQQLVGGAVPTASQERS